MSKKEHPLYGEIVVSSVSLEKANFIRSFIKQNTVGYWVYVFKNRNKSGSYNIGAQNTWGASLSAEELKEIKSCVKTAKETLKS